MKNFQMLLFTMMFLMIQSSLSAQLAAELYVQSIEKSKAGKFTEAIQLLNKSIELEPENVEFIYQRGYVNLVYKYYDQALEDLYRVIKLDSTYANAYFLSGVAYKSLTEYDLSLKYFTKCIALDAQDAESYYYRGLIHLMFKRMDEACQEFLKAKDLGLENAIKHYEDCTDSTFSINSIYPILSLSKKATNEKYGFNENDPIKVGLGPEGGPANQRAYLNLLRDAKGNPISYRRTGSGPSYKSENALFGTAIMDMYEISYLDKNGEKQKSIIYISMYDYEEPKILYGFNTIEKKKSH